MKTAKLVAALFAVFTLAPLGALAHQTTIYEIGGVEYEFVVGSLGEPVVVDDKTGLDFELVRDGEPVVGAQEFLKVEFSAGSEAKVMELSPVYGSEGRYKTNFLATVATTLKYRIFGKLEGMPIDFTFTCNPAGHPQASENTERVDISSGVVQTLQRGSFGCPQEKADFGFPEPSVDVVSLEARIASLDEEVNRTKEVADTAHTTALGALAVALVAVAFGLLRRRQKKAVTE